MTILNEPIGTWISIAAFIISLSTLLLSLRKQRDDERTALADKIAEIKALYGQSMRTIDEIIEKNDNLETSLRKKFPEADLQQNLAMIQKNRSSLEELRSKVERTYNRLGYRTPATTDPLVLSAVAVESDEINKALEKEKEQVEDVTKAIDAIIMRKTRNRKSAPLRAHPQKRSNKRG